MSAIRSTGTQVLIVGAGPTGLSLALFLARCGLLSLLIERNTGPQAHPAACILNTRTMEVFREIGMADRILGACQDVFARSDITWVTRLAGRELARISALPADVGAALAQSPVHATHFPQNRLEPLLWEAVRAEPLITFRPGVACTGISQTGNGVEARLSSAAGEISASAAYAVICEGASGSLRRSLGIASDGRLLQDMIGIYFTADLAPLVEHRRSILYWTLNAEAPGVLIAHWLPTEWVLFVPYQPPQQSPASFDAARCRSLVAAAVGFEPGDLDIRLVRSWTLAARLARQYRDGRIFLAGDAAHAFPPTGGFGLNTGVQDAHNLAWKLALVLGGQAGPGLLDTYEQERRPVAARNLAHSVRNFDAMNELFGIAGIDLRRERLLRAVRLSALFRLLPERWQESIVEKLSAAVLGRLSVFDADNERAARARAAFAAAAPGQAPHYRFLGLDLGFAYERGALVPDGTAKPEAADPITDYRPTTWPGARVPHFWVSRDGQRSAIHDTIPAGRFGLLTDPASRQAWREAAMQTGKDIAVEVLAIGQSAPDTDLVDLQGDWPRLSEAGPGGAVLVRPDGHVAWRASRLPPEPAATLREVFRAILGGRLRCY